MTVVRLTAAADVGEPQPGETPGGASIDVELTALLDDGRRIVIGRRGYGWIVGHYSDGPVDAWPPPADPWAFETRASVEDGVRNVLIPDDDDDPEPLPWAWIVGELRTSGVTATAGELKAVAFEVVLSERLRARVDG